MVESLKYDDLRYMALSYTWSSPVSESAIVIGRFPLHNYRELETSTASCSRSCSSKEHVGRRNLHQSG